MNTPLNESYANFFLDKWSIYAPNATFVNLDKELLDDIPNAIYHQPSYYDTPTFASEYLENCNDLNDLILPINKATYKRILNPFDFLHIALFDTWVENDDRRPSNYNLMLKHENGKDKVIPIDHAFIFSTLGYDDLDPTLYSPISNDHLLVSELGKLIKNKTKVDQNFIKMEEQYFYLCVGKCKEDIDNFTEQLSFVYNLDNTSIEKMKTFIFDDNRNKQVFEEYITRLKQ